MNRHGKRQKCENDESVKKKKQAEKPKQKNWYGEMCICPMSKSIRTFEFKRKFFILTTILYINHNTQLAILLLLSLLIYMTATSNTTLTDITLILLIILAAAYLFIIVIDIISQFGGDSIPDTPMLVLSTIGALLFSMAAVPLFFHLTTDPDKKNANWAVITTFALCLVITTLFLIDVTTILAYWRQRLTALRKCCPHVSTPHCDDTKILFLRSNVRSPIDTEVGKCNLTTSISNCRQPPELDDATSHVYRKIGFGSRRQYTDTTTDMPSRAAVNATCAQTDPGQVTITECQTSRQEIREKPIQTCSRCEFCDCRLNQPPTCPTHCSLCPATIVHLVRDTVNPSCCTACKCDRGSTRTQDQLQSQRKQPSYVNTGTSGSMTSEKDLVVGESRGSPVKKLPRVYETRPCPTHGAGLAARIAGLPETVTRVTLPPYCIRKNKRTQTPSVQILSNESTLERPKSAGSELARSEQREKEKLQEVESVNKNMIQSMYERHEEKEEDTSMKNRKLDENGEGTVELRHDDEKMRQIEGESLHQVETNGKNLKQKADGMEEIVEELVERTIECVSPNEHSRDSITQECFVTIKKSNDKSRCLRKKEKMIRRTSVFQRKHKVDPMQPEESQEDPIPEHDITLRTESTKIQTSETRILDAKQIENVWNTVCINSHTKQLLQKGAERCAKCSRLQVLALSNDPITVTKTDAATMIQHPEGSTTVCVTNLAASSSLHSIQLEKARSKDEISEKSDSTTRKRSPDKTEKPKRDSSRSPSCSRTREGTQRMRKGSTDTTRWRPKKRNLHNTCYLT